MRIKRILSIVLFILLTITGLSIILTRNMQSRGQVFESNILVHVKQLASDKGKIPVELRCDGAELQLPNKLENLNCYAVNNTNKSITALVIAYTISMKDSIKEDGKLESFSSAVTIETLLHPDFYEYRKESFITPNTNTPINILPITFEPTLVIKDMTVQVDYVKFEDNSSINEKGDGATLVKEIRQGVAKYKDQFTNEFKRNINSETTLKQLIQESRFIKDKNLVELTPKQSEGANFFRKFIRRIYETKGITGVKEVLKIDK